MEALFLDTRERRLPIYTVYVTRVGDGKFPPQIVLRMGAEVGSLHDVRESLNINVPVLVATKGYQAQSSAGFVSVQTSCQLQCWVVGQLGFPDKMGKSTGLRVLGDPIQCVVVGSEPEQRQLQIRHVPGMDNSNYNTAGAAVRGLRLRAGLHWSLMVIEGQSDRAVGFEVEGANVPADGNFFGQIPEEHRAERFAPMELLNAALRRQAAIAAASRVGEEARSATAEERLGFVLLFATMISVGVKSVEEKLPWLYRQVLQAELHALADGLASSEYFRGWEIRVEEPSVRAVSPEGKTVAWEFLEKKDLERFIPYFSKASDVASESTAVQ